MKVEIKYNEKNQPIGWSIQGENSEEKEVVNKIRNLQFFGFDDTAIKYNGRTGGNDTTDAGKLHWIQKKYQSS